MTLPLLYIFFCGGGFKELKRDLISDRFTLYKSHSTLIAVICNINMSFAVANNIN